MNLPESTLQSAHNTLDPQALDLEKKNLRKGNSSRIDRRALEIKYTHKTQQLQLLDPIG